MSWLQSNQGMYGRLLSAGCVHTDYVWTRAFRQTASNHGVRTLLAATNELLAGHTGALWQRTELLPGLELHLSAAASAAVKAAARRIIDEYVGG